MSITFSDKVRAVIFISCEWFLHLSSCLCSGLKCVGLRLEKMVMSHISVYQSEFSNSCIRIWFRVMGPYQWRAFEDIFAFTQRYESLEGKITGAWVVQWQTREKKATRQPGPTKDQEQRKVECFFLYLYPLPLENTALPSSLSQRDGDPPEHTVRHKVTQRQPELEP